MNALYIFVVFVATTLSITLAANCYGPTSPIFINEFSAFPSPVGVGETVYIRAEVTPAHNISAALVQVRVYYSTNPNVDTQSPIISMSGLDFCSLSTKIRCPLTTAGSILAWEFVVPDIPAGTYQVKYNIIELNATDPTTASSCIQFSIEVSGTNASPIFNSWYQATLLGTAVFTSPGDYTTRGIGQSLQVGPSGPLNFSSPPYGTINGLSGSGDLVPSSNYDTSAFVWGLSGTMTSNSIGNPSTVQTHVYRGTCYLGYIQGDNNSYDYTNPLMTGTFYLTWSYTSGSTAHISGYATFYPNATIPPHWGYPLLFGRFQQHQIVTSDTGFLLIKASAPYCTSDGSNCNLGSSVPTPTGGSSGLSSNELGLAIGLPIAVVFVVVLVAAALLWNKRRRETEQEDGIFAVARKPEYGSALVVDDIIEETRGSKNLRAMLSPNAYSEDEAASNDESDDRSASRSRSRSASRRSVSHSRSVSRSRSRSRSSEGRSNRSSDNESDAGESASRGRHSSEYSD